MALNGIDVASYQTGIDLTKVPCDFVIVKATEGTGYVNPDFDRAYDQAVGAGKLVGIYHYANGSSGAVAEADYFLYWCGDRVGNAILVLDWESQGNSAFNNPNYAKQWLDRVYERTGVRPLIYMSKSVCRQYNWSEVAKNHGLWVAQYANYNRTGYQTNPWTDSNGYGAWNSPAIFQYSSSGMLDGWNGNLDLNIAYMDSVAWGKYAKGDNHSVNTENPSADSNKGDIDNMTEEQVKEIINSMEKVYNTVDELPFGADTIQKLIDKGILKGESNNKQKLGISYDLLRVLVINDRAGLYD